MKFKSITKKVITPLYGEIDVDANIADLIFDLNSAGIATMNSCSGLSVDHPEFEEIYESNGYIQFRLNYELHEFLSNYEDIYEKYGIQVSMSETLYDRFGCGNNVYISLMGESEEVRLEQWRIVRQILYEYINSLKKSGDAVVIKFEREAERCE